jgi:pre-mRNA-processing factor 17
MSGKNGSLEQTSIQDFTFNEQFQSYQRSGYAVDSSTNQVIGSKKMYNLEKGMSAKAEKDRVTKKRKVETPLEEEDDDEAANAGPWAKFVDPVDKSSVKKKGDSSEEQPTIENDETVDNNDNKEKTKSTIHIQEPDEEDEKWEKVNERKMAFTLPPRPARGSQIAEAKSTFHGAEKVDYQGRAWCVAPSSMKADPEGTSHECFIPKKCVKKLTGHTKGVQALEYFPGTGHLLLSGSMDGKCKIWDSHTSDMGVQMTYAGHSEAVRSIHMSNTGSHFLSSGFDRLVRYWDVETGQAAGTFSNRKMAYQVRFWPRDNNLFIAACNDNKLYQWDIRTGEVCQEYNHHLQPVNTVTFIDEGRKFVSTSDDKKILVWEFDIPVPIKYIADPSMQCVPAVSLHPSHLFFAGQSMDNKIVVYSAGEKVRQITKKTFQGHNNTGYACQIGFSPNGKFLVSGDGLGQVHFWDWKSCKSYRKFHAHDSGPCMAAVWHPLHPSQVATCGWDGLIKIWE